MDNRVPDWPMVANHQTLRASDKHLMHRQVADLEVSDVKVIALLNRRAVASQGPL
jgi:hypothetical protein